MLIELNAAVGDLVNYYIQRRAEEMYFETAQLRSSVVGLARNRGYSVYRAISARGDVRVKVLDIDYSNIRYVVKGAIFEADSGVRYVAKSTVEIAPGVSEVLVPVIQGVWQSQSFISDGEASQVMDVISDTIENTEYIVRVFNGAVYETWQQVLSFLQSDAESKNYTAMTYEEGLRIRLGNGVFGKIPVSSMPIEVAFIESIGKSGNLYETGIELTLISGAPEVAWVKTETQLIGGQDEESIDSIKWNAPRFVVASGRAVTPGDYLFFMKSVPGIVAARAWGEREENPPNIEMMNRVRVACLYEDNVFRLDEATPETDLNFTVTRRAEIEELLYAKNNITVTLEEMKTEIIGLFLQGNVLCKIAYGADEIKQSLIDIIADKYSIASAAYGEGVRYSEIIKAMYSVEGVLYVENLYIGVVLKHYVNNTGAVWSSMVATVFDNAPWQAGTVKIYISKTLNPVTPDPGTELILLCQDDGVGGLVGSTGYTVVGAVNYTTGEIEIVSVSSGVQGPIAIQAVPEELKNYEVDKQGVLVYFGENITVTPEEV